MESKLKHLEFIQTTISRMAGNSFLLKAWTVTLVAGLFALAAKDADRRYIILAYIPVLVFWILDGFYVWQERLYRALYDEVRLKKAEDINFAMDTTCHQGGRNTWVRSTVSRTVLTFYGPLVALMLVVMRLLK